VICWLEFQKSREKTYLSRVDIELINEQIKFFLLGSRCGRNNLDEDTFTIIEYVPLNDKTSYYPLENKRFIFMIMVN
jgi:hypothetical protein